MSHTDFSRKALLPYILHNTKKYITSQQKSFHLNTVSSVMWGDIFTTQAVKLNSQRHFTQAHQHEEKNNPRPPSYLWILRTITHLNTIKNNKHYCTNIK